MAEEQWELNEAIELVKVTGEWRGYPGTGGIWIGSNKTLADARFDDWGLARAVASIINAVKDGRLKNA